jgi:3-hydroxyisobutyrate dehydrogenase-like beta-hydroxyacid dehydrogenase
LAASQAVESLAAIEQLTSAIERLAVAPVSIDTLPPNDVTPRAELGDIKALTVEAIITDTSTNLIASSVALTNGAAAAGGTLLNAPAAGNPTKWVPINDNGTIRYIPSW